jgi:peroxiredoxin
MQGRNKRIVIATTIVLVIAVYVYVMMVCLLHEQPVEKAGQSGTQVATAPKKEEVTAPPRQVDKPRPSRPAIPPITRPPVARRTEGPLIGNEAPNFLLRDLNGRQVELSSTKGKMVILDFWATWCPPCVREIPHFVELYEKYGNRGLVILGVSTDRKGVSVVNSFVRRHKVNYPILMADVKVKEAYGGIRSIPTTFVIDKTGKIQRRYVGYRDKAVFEADIKALLVPGESLIADLKSEDPSVRLDAAESLVTRESSLEPEVFLRFCNDMAETASQNLDIAVRMHKVTAQYLSHTQLSGEDLACLKGLP